MVSLTTFGTIVFCPKTVFDPRIGSDIKKLQ